MPKQARKRAAASLPKRAPKRTGKRGVGPAPESSEPQPDVQTELPGMEDRHIEEIEDAARNYARIRDRRMALTREETDLKDLLHQIMLRNDKKLYRVAEMEVKIVAKEETVKVKLTDPDEE
jgi:hypothetical protein